MNKNPVYIGIDVAKHSLEIDSLNQSTISIPNSLPAIRKWIKRIQRLPHPFVCCEATGGYEKLLVGELLNAKIPVAVLNPVQVRDFARSKGILAKTDRIDTNMITQFAQQNHPRAQQPEPAWLVELRALLVRREQLLLMITQEQNRLDPAPSPSMTKMIQSHLRVLKRQVDSIHKQFKVIIQSTPELKQLYLRLLAVKSIGIISALSLIAFVPELGTVSDKQAAALVGVAPYNRDSGKSRGRRTIQQGRARVRKAIYMAALTAIGHNPILRSFYQRLRDAGKPQKVAITAVMRKLIVLANRIASDREFKLA